MALKAHARTSWGDTGIGFLNIIFNAQVAFFWSISTICKSNNDWFTIDMSLIKCNKLHNLDCRLGGGGDLLYSVNYILYSILFIYYMALQLSIRVENFPDNQFSRLQYLTGHTDVLVYRILLIPQPQTNLFKKKGWTHPIVAMLFLKYKQNIRKT